MRNVLQDIKFGLRILSGSPGFALVAMLTLGLGIACTTTVFSWIDGVMLHPFPGTSHSDELAVLEMITANAPNGGTNISWLDYRDYRERLQGVSGVAVRRQCAFTFGEEARARVAWGELVSGNYFDVMGVRMRLGRGFTREETGDDLGAHAVAIISERLWRDYFHADPAISGKTVRINRHPLTIVGVTPDEFHGSWPVMQYDLWVPVTMAPALGALPEGAFTERDFRGWLDGICRLRAGLRVESARAEAGTIAANLAQANPKTNSGISATILAPWDAHNGINELLHAPLRILLAVSVLVLLIVCANVANLLLARSVGRQREFGIRCAVGASRSRLAMQVLTETLILAIGAAGVGILMLMWMRGSLAGMLPNVGFPIVTAYALNPRILLFTAAACMATALISGVSPALFVFRSNLNEVLKEGSRSDTAGAASRRTRSLLVVGEVALATVALLGAGLFLQSFHNARAIEPGFEAGHVLFGRFFLDATGFSRGEVPQFASRLKQRLLASPGVDVVSYSNVVPLSTTAGPYYDVTVPGYTPAPGESPNASSAMVGPDYFATMRIPLLEGRDFTDRDDPSSGPVSIVNQAFAQRYFHGESPVGRKIDAAGKSWRIVGMAKDSKYFSPTEAARPYLYLPFRQSDRSAAELDVLVRTAGNPADAIPLFRKAVADTDGSVTAFHTIPLNEYTVLATYSQKVTASLMGTLALMCLLLAALGLYSVMSYTVSQRTAEIAIRTAMGARPRNVITMVIGQGMVLALAGVVIGAAAALAATHAVAGMLIGVSAADPATFAVVTLFLLVLAAIATWLPAFRATRIDPLPALRK
ncbi:MAG TPA: ABC transporter permease [Bryobacteraceae bacterium]|nr:ABC transporter permease [Bryobacteraceae bacterium]